MNRFSNNCYSHLQKLKITRVFSLKAVAEYLTAEVHLTKVHIFTLKP